MLRSLVLSCGFAFVAASPAAAAPFGVDSVWEAPLASNAPLAPNSSALVGELRRQAAGPGGVWINTTQFSVPVYTVGLTQPNVRVELETYSPPLQADLERVPIPDHAAPSPDSDAHLVVYQPLTDTLWEFWRARRESDGWHAVWGGKMENVSRNPGYFDHPFGGSATSLALLGGLITIAEMRAGRIDHALALSIPQTKRADWVWPAQRTDGVADGAEAIPAGTRFRIDPALDLDTLNLTRPERILAQAMQDHGLIVRDQAGAVTIFGEDPAQYGHNPWPELLNDWPHFIMQKMPWSHMQAVVPDRSVFRQPLVPPVLPAVQTPPTADATAPAPVVPPTADATAPAPVVPPVAQPVPAPPAPAATPPATATTVTSPKAKAKAKAKANRAQAKAKRLCAKARGRRATITAKRRCRVASEEAVRARRHARFTASG
ncbi:hypothetical protein [Solirubrobacter deserti]|uniref:Uncharacterized protein n=1 Tax=Solirubrobacter deserti TaxID=2282478 RepID=A0ABT4RM58_9ACTN|nr:hypothetical protein [Solirubrobacter deserti]MDA0139650.1 hypothetical protein [Solirubrobacter deserti]